MRPGLHILPTGIMDKLICLAILLALAFGGTVEQNKKALDLCKVEGVKALIYDSRVMAKRSRDKDFAANLDAVIADYGSHPDLRTARG